MNDETLAALRQFSEKVKHISPEIAKLLEEGKDEKETLMAMMSLVQNDPELAKKVEEAAKSAFRPEVGQQVEEEIKALKTLPDRQEMLAELNFEEEDLLFQPEGAGLPQLHPMVAAYIGERLQFDDDIPELRTGSLPESAKPAVPVETSARSPIMIGAQLAAASDQVKEELTKAQLARAEELTALEEGITDETENNLPAKARSQFIAVAEKAVGVEGYRPGHKAVARKVEGPSGAELVQLSTELQKRYAYKVLTSTAGRRSASPVIAGIILDELSKRGVQATLATVGKSTPPFTQDWISSIDAAEGDINPLFNFVDTAAKAIAIGLHRQLQKAEVDRVLLEIKPFSDVRKRRAGWTVYAKPPE